MVRGFAFLLLFQLVGEMATRGLGLPVPGPVVGLALLVAALALRHRWAEVDEAALAASGLAPVADGLLANLAMLFVPAGVGVVQYLDLIGAHGTAIGTALVLSTLITLVATVVTFVAVKRLIRPRGEEAGR